MSTATHATLSPLADETSLARAVLYASVALALRPPDAGTRGKLGSPSEARALQRASSLLPAPGAEALGRALHRLTACARTLSLAQLRATHARLFGHTTRGALSAYETEYGQDTPFQQPQQLSDIGAFLHAFGLRLDSQRHERIDHVCVECEFLAFLCRKESWARDHEDAAMLEATRAAYRLFLGEHLGRFARALGRLLASEDPDGLHGAAGEVLQNLIILECRRVGVASGPEFLPLRAPEEDSTPMACATSGDLHQIRSSPDPGA